MPGTPTTRGYPTVDNDDASNLEDSVNPTFEAINDDVQALATALAALPKTLRGIVNADGTIAAGSGFTIFYAGTGTYRIITPSIYPSAPVFSFFPSDNTPGRQVVLEIPWSGVSTILCQIRIESAAGTPTDVPFHFHAIAA